MRRRTHSYWLLLLIGMLWRHPCSAQSFQITERCKQAYQQALSLNFTPAKILLNEEKRQSPKNYFPIFLENYIDFLTVFTSESHRAYEALHPNKDMRLEQLQQSDALSPYCRYTQAEVNLQWAVLEVQQGDYFQAVWSIQRAYNLLQENKKIFPQFLPNKKSLGLINALLSSVPDSYKWGLTLLGMSADADGFRELRELQQQADNDFLFRQETTILYSLLLFHLQHQPAQAWQLLQQQHLPAPQALMERYAYLYVAVYGKHTDAALNLRQQASNFAADNDRFPQLHLLMGLAYLNSGENTEAAGFLNRFLMVYKGSNHLKAALQKLAWINALKGDTAGYFTRMNELLKTGATVIDADKQAQQEATSRQFPDVPLLRARLLFDGGYFQKALEALPPENTRASALWQTEYSYRKARILHEWGRTAEALTAYQKTINNGKQLNRYFAPNAAYQMGLIYLDQGDTTRAREYFNYTLNFQNHEYKNSLDQKAKAALNQLKK
ncbi:MAG: hypothetical protein U0T84_02950 [Chitinophagales bacterium]